MYRITHIIPEFPLVRAGSLSADALRAYKQMSFRDEVVIASTDVFIKADSQTGNVWVSAPGCGRTLLQHVRIFERNIIDLFSDAKHKFNAHG